MTKRSRSYMQGRFQNGDRPDENDFFDLFESTLWYNDLPESLSDNNAKKLTAPAASTAWSLSDGARLSLAAVAENVTVTVTDDRDTLNKQLDQLTVAFQQDGTGGRTLTLVGLTLVGGAVTSGKVVVDPTANAWTLIRLHRVNGAWYVVSSAFNEPRSRTIDPAGSGETWTAAKSEQGQRLVLLNATENVDVDITFDEDLEQAVVAFEQVATPRTLTLTGATFAGDAIDGTGKVDVDIRDGAWTIVHLQRLTGASWFVTSSAAKDFPLVPVALF